MNLHPQTQEAYLLLHRGTLALTRAEQQGFRIDVEYCHNTTNDLTAQILAIEKQIHASTFYSDWKRSRNGNAPNINSGPQLQQFLYRIKKIEPPAKTKSGQGSVDDESLSLLNIPELGMLLEIRKLKKMRDTYLGAFVREQVNGYLHPFFNLHLARTFRSSSDRPNFQNIPKRDQEAMEICRKAIYPRPGHQLMEVDYKGIEVAIAACYHKDPTMIKYLEDPTSDMHLDMAAQIFCLTKPDKSDGGAAYLRSAAKNGFVFPQFYGDYYKNCASSLAKWGKLPEGRWKVGQGTSLHGSHLADHLISNEISSFSKFVQHIKEIEEDFWGSRFPVYNKWKQLHWKAYQKNGYIDMKTGFRCIGIMGNNDCINYPVQGAAFHCLLWSFVRLDEIMRKENWQTRLIGQIHDAIIFDIYPPELEMVSKTLRRVMCEELKKEWKWINVPISIDADLAGIDKSWAEVKTFRLPK